MTCWLKYVEVCWYVSHSHYMLCAPGLTPQWLRAVQTPLQGQWVLQLVDNEDNYISKFLAWGEDQVAECEVVSQIQPVAATEKHCCFIYIYISHIYVYFQNCKFWPRNKWSTTRGKFHAEKRWLHWPLATKQIQCKANECGFNIIEFKGPLKDYLRTTIMNTLLIFRVSALSQNIFRNFEKDTEKKCTNSVMSQAILCMESFCYYWSASQRSYFCCSQLRVFVLQSSVSTPQLILKLHQKSQGCKHLYNTHPVIMQVEMTKLINLTSLPETNLKEKQSRCNIKKNFPPNNMRHADSMIASVCFQLKKKLS